MLAAMIEATIMLRVIMHGEKCTHTEIIQCK